MSTTAATSVEAVSAAAVPRVAATAAVYPGKIVLVLPWDFLNGSCLPGLYTGAVYRDPALQKNGFPGEGLLDGAVVVIKTHKLATEPHNPSYARAILIIRSPFDAIVSEFNRLNSAGHSHIGTASKAAYQTGR